jgi:uncharacterized membrane protein HdeD (DUF308 family)
MSKANFWKLFVLGVLVVIVGFSMIRQHETLGYVHLTTWLAACAVTSGLALTAVRD